MPSGIEGGGCVAGNSVGFCPAVMVWATSAAPVGSEDCRAKNEKQLVSFAISNSIPPNAFRRGIPGNSSPGMSHAKRRAPSAVSPGNTTALRRVLMALIHEAWGKRYRSEKYSPSPSKLRPLMDMHRFWASKYKNPPRPSTQCRGSRKLMPSWVASASSGWTKTKVWAPWGMHAFTASLSDIDGTVPSGLRRPRRETEDTEVKGSPRSAALRRSYVPSCRLRRRLSPIRT
mmetsp:Transcript_20127/g.34705  ORF Transcript_20127/g.34705 Transcript_20127/m.34705 type:complete len:230 (+) Transcript_20127:232-921(+)